MREHFVVEVRRKPTDEWVRQDVTSPTLEEADDAAWSLSRFYCATGLETRVIRVTTVEAVARDTDSSSCVWNVMAGSGHNGYRTFTDEAEALAYFDAEAAVPSYLGKGIAGGGSGFQPVSISRAISIFDNYRRNR